MDSAIFRAYDIRGKYPEEIDEAGVRRIARALAAELFKGKRVMVGRDARLSSPKLYRAALAGLRRGGAKPVEAGLVTTPMLYFSVNDARAEGGVMITASHNPPEYNGMKAVRRGAEPLSGKEIYGLLEKLESRK